MISAMGALAGIILGVLELTFARWRKNIPAFVIVFMILLAFGVAGLATPETPRARFVFALLSANTVTVLLSLAVPALCRRIRWHSKENAGSATAA